MIDKNRIQEILKERAKLHQDDPRIVNLWDDLTEILTQSENETISYLDTCSENEIYWISEVFEDISMEFRSESFLKCIESLQLKFNGLNLEEDILYAKRAIKC